MIERFAVLAGRIRQELSDSEKVVSRAERAVLASTQSPVDQDLYLDSAALNLHDFYTGIERIFYHVATTMDRSVPSGHEWRRELLRQMGLAIPQIRPAVLSGATVQAIEEFLRFRHVVRNIYAFEFDPERISQLANKLRPTFGMLEADLLAFAAFLEELANED